MKSTLFSLLASTEAIKLQLKSKAKQDGTCGAMPEVSIDPDFVTFMGFSSGSYNSHSQLVMNSSYIKGAAMLNGSIYGKSYGEKINPTRMTEDEETEAIAAEVAEAQEKLAKREQEEMIDPLSGLDGVPCYIHSGNDMSMPQPNQIAQKDLLESYGANVKYVYDEEQGHDYKPERPGEAIAWVFGNLPGSGIDLEPVLESDSRGWKEDSGTLTAFDQAPFINAALEEFSENGPADVDHQLDLTRPGYIYVPKACESKTCKYTMVSHGAGGSGDYFANQFAPYAAVYDIIMVFPQAIKAWDDEAYSGDLYDTNKGIQSIYFRKIMEHLTGESPVDQNNTSGSECSTAKPERQSGGDEGQGDQGERPEQPAGDRPEQIEGDGPERPERPEQPSGDRPERPSGDRPERPSGDRPERPERPSRK